VYEKKRRDPLPLWPKSCGWSEEAKSVRTLSGTRHTLRLALVRRSSSAAPAEESLSASGGRQRFVRLGASGACGEASLERVWVADALLVSADIVGVV